MELGAHVRSSQCPFAEGSYVCQWDKTSVKKRRYLQDVHHNLCVSNLLRQTSSKQPCTLAWNWPTCVGTAVKFKNPVIAVTSLGTAPSPQGVSDPKPPALFTLSKVAVGWTTVGLPQALSRLELPSSRTGLARGDTFFPFTASGLILSSLILVLCNSITLVKLPPDLYWCEWMGSSPWGFDWSMMLHYFWTSSCAGCATDKNNVW